MASFDIDTVFIITETPEEAWGEASKKQEMARQMGDERARALGLIKAAEALALMGKTDEAQGQAMEAMAICSELRFEEGRGAAMNAMTKVHLKRGRDEEELEEALDSGMDALKHFQKLGFRRGEAAALASLSSVYTAMGRAGPAAKRAKEALAAYAEFGDQAAMAEMYHLVMAAHLSKSPPDTFRAAKALEKALAIFRELGDKNKEAACTHTLATVEVKRQDYKKAAEALAKSKALYIEVSNFHGQAAVMETLMSLYVEAGMYHEAVKVGQQRVTVFHDGGDMSNEGKALVKLGQMVLDHEDTLGAERLAQAALGLFAGINDFDGLKIAKDLLDAAKHAQAVETIGMALQKAADFTHIPATLIIEPGMTKRIGDAYVSSMR